MVRRKKVFTKNQLLIICFGHKHQYYKNPPPDWDTAKINFQKAWNAVEHARQEIAAIQSMQEEYSHTLLEQAAETEILDNLESVNNNLRCAADSEQEVLGQLENNYTLLQQNIMDLKSSLPWYKRLLSGLFKNNAVIIEWKKSEQQASKTIIAITQQRTKLQTAEEKSKNAQAAVDEQHCKLKEIQAHLQALNVKLEPARTRFGGNYVNDDFWGDITINESAHTACPWTDIGYDTLREELFYQSLMLHKAFILNSKSVKQNLSRLFNMWDSKFGLEDQSMAYGSLLNTLFFVIPVISTTFASVHNFLGNIKPAELGILVIDESGQATPQSALGALWRTQKAIVVGDPLQVEPIMTTPIELCKRLAEDNSLSTIYRVPKLSVQMLADANNQFGGYRETNSEKLWVGCPLVIHRRCIEPMFSMSNDVAYNGRMFCKTSPPSAETMFLLEESVWFDIAGNEKGNKNHAVPAQIDKVASLVEQAMNKFGAFPDLYIITPFVSVKRELITRLYNVIKSSAPELSREDINAWLKSNCGTIHTFQGKEANEVLLVLGCDGQTGRYAAQWVGQKPNIINVAVSRAKYRIGIIGDYSLWKDISYVQTICNQLNGNIQE